MNFDSDANNDALTPAQWSVIDRNAWEAICRWPSYADFDPIHEGLDFSELTRWFLWDKVARSVRHEIDPAAFSHEARSMGWEDSNRLRRASSRPSPARRIARRIRASLSKGKNAAAARFQA